MIENPGTRQIQVQRLLSSDYARDRLARAFLEILDEGLSFGPRDLPQRDDREWLRGAIAVPIQRATDTALEALIVELAGAFERAPAGLVERIAESRRSLDVGCD